jgi:hypothetical protein
MRGPRRLLPLVAGVIMVVGSGSANAQSVVLRGAAPGSTLDVLRNDAAVGSATVAPTGDAVVAFESFPDPKTKEADVFVFVDECGNTWRVLVSDRGRQPAPPEPRCARTDIGALFLLTNRSSLVVSVGGRAPTLLLIQGRYDPESTTARALAPTGFMVFGGAGLASVTNASEVGCGSVPQCTSSGYGIGYTFGVGYWPLPFLGAEAAFMKPSNDVTSGSTSTYRFDTALDARMLTFVGKGGVPAGTARIYGLFGLNYVEATVRTSQINDDVIVPVDGVGQVLEGGSQSWELRTSGWSWLLGGGAEIWVTPRIGIFGEVNRAILEGTSIDDVEGTIDYRLLSFLFGVKVRIVG